MWKLALGAIAIGALAVPSAAAQDQPTPRPRIKVDVQANADANASAASNLAFRASDLMDLDVRNAQGETVGSVHDLVIDVETGKVRYVAVAYGGFAGLGDKLFAIPLKQFKVKKDTEDDVYFLSTNLSEERMKSAPGFDEENWPAMASQTQWTQQVDKYYGDGDSIEGVDATNDATNDAAPRAVPRVEIEVAPPRANRGR
jgi:sporulation protein YlmC with PRC-barrel domain